MRHASQLSRNPTLATVSGVTHKKIYVSHMRHKRYLCVTIRIFMIKFNQDYIQCIL